MTPASRQLRPLIAALIALAVCLAGCGRKRRPEQAAQVPVEESAPAPPAPRNIPILCMHDIGPDAQNAYSIKTADLERYIQWLDDEGFETVTARDVVAYLNGETDLPEKPIVISFDDNWRSALTVARPLLDKHGFVGVAFVISSSVGANERKLTWDDCKQLAEAGWEIGSHTKTHENLTYVKQGQAPESIRAMAEDQIRGSKQRIEAEIGLEVTSIALPYGNYDSFVLETIEDAGYQAALTIDRGSADEQSDPFRLPRRMIMNATSFNTFKRICTAKTLHIADMEPRPGSRVSQASVTISGTVTDDDVAAAPVGEVQGKPAEITLDPTTRQIAIKADLDRGANSIALATGGRELSWLVIRDD